MVKYVFSKKIVTMRVLSVAGPPAALPALYARYAPATYRVEGAYIRA